MSVLEPDRIPERVHQEFTQELHWKRLMQEALDLAARFKGATSPNPPVGAVLADAHGNIIGRGAHQQAGTAHAEIHAIEDWRKTNPGQRPHVLVVTLEPCDHTGLTPPCTETIITAGIPNVIVGTTDPNPKVDGRGIAALARAGVQVQLGVLEDPCQKLIAPWAHWIRTKKPWIVVKTALDEHGSRIPPSGSKTFTSEDSLRLAHQMRKESDAILTGSGTILADHPEFTVRHVPDHADKRRWLVLFDRRKRVPEEWVERARQRGFQILRPESLEQALEELGRRQVIQVLVEAGPTLTESILSSSLWNEHIIIQKGAQKGAPDEVTTHIHPSGGA